jgi:hypothetical protein
MINRKSGFLYPTWMHPGRIWRHSENDDKSLLKVRGECYKSLWWGQVETRSRESVFLFPGAFKIGANLWEGDSQSPVTDEWEGAWVIPGLRWG